MHRKEIEPRMILLALVGSQAYGTATPTSDRDYKGIFIAPKEYYLGFKTIEQKDAGWQSEAGSGLFPFLDKVQDCVAYELRKFLTLIGNNNPNILEILWLDPEFYLYLTPLGERLIYYREDFLSQKVRGSFAGYAYAQIKKVESHRKWLLNPPECKPVPQDFGLNEDDYKPLTKSEMNAFLEFLYMLVRDCIEYLDAAEELRILLLEKIDYKGLLKQHNLPEEVLPKIQEYTRSTDDFIRLLHVSQAYRRSLREWEAYCQWRKRRHPERQELERKCGYDAKHMSHCIRLLKMGIEVLRDGVINVNRKKVGDADYLLTIRQGDVAYQEVKELADNLFNELQEVSTDLPSHVNREKLNEVCVELVEMAGW
ncbi:MAG: nucleotidyltransferase domain-containing protein [Oscillatoria sp. PMC 1051.18]|nr:nucleotidyltransferase domain-containing protein [Oscillatoria sp. PMC 1050.18]MEC5030993.1 nucleotidyltransferase domain-containing protein [Oscillatoria sp. PMC 1051.18]